MPKIDVSFKRASRDMQLYLAVSRGTADIRVKTGHMLDLVSRL